MNEERLNSFIGFLFTGSGLTGLIDWFVDFSNKYFIALSCFVFLITTIYKLGVWVKNKKRTFKKNASI